MGCSMFRETTDWNGGGTPVADIHRRLTRLEQNVPSDRRLICCQSDSLGKTSQGVESLTTQKIGEEVNSAILKMGISA